MTAGDSRAWTNRCRRRCKHDSHESFRRSLVCLKHALDSRLTRRFSHSCFGFVEKVRPQRGSETLPSVPSDFRIYEWLDYSEETE